MSSTLDRARNIGMAGLFTVLSLGIAANNDNKAYAKVPASPNMELFADDGGKDDPGAKDAPNNDKPVPGKDLRNERFDVADFASAGLSTKGVVILYCGTDRATFDEIRRGATDAKNEGANVRGVVWGKTDPRIANGQEFFTVYADGHLVRKADTEKANIREKVKENCHWANKEYLANKNTPPKITQEVAGITHP